MTAARFFMFDINETLTSVAESFKSYVIGGTKNLIEFSFPIALAISQTE
jgi:hypothetical protein